MCGCSYVPIKLYWQRQRTTIFSMAHRLWFAQSLRHLKMVIFLKISVYVTSELSAFSAFQGLSSRTSSGFAVALAAGALLSYYRSALKRTHKTKTHTVKFVSLEEYCIKDLRGVRVGVPLCISELAPW